MTNPVQPQACEILSVKRAAMSGPSAWPPRKPAHGQFMQLSIPMIGEAPISVSAQGDGWLEFTIRSVGKVTNVIFEKEAGIPSSSAAPTARAGPWSSSGTSTWWSSPAAPAWPRPLHAQHAGGRPRLCQVRAPHLRLQE